MRVDVSMLVSLQVIDLCVLVLRLFRSRVVSRSSTVVGLHIRMAVNFVKDVLGHYTEFSTVQTGLVTSVTTLCVLFY